MSAFINRKSPFARLRTAFKAIACMCAALLLISGTAQAASGIRDAEVERFLRDIGIPIFRAAGLQPSAVDFIVLNDNDLNAFVTRGQRIYVNTGLINEVESVMELRGVIAHETGHIAGGHIARTEDALSNARTPLLVTMGLGILAAAAGAPDAGAALVMSGQHVVERSILAYSRAQESSADQAAVTYLDRIGENPSGLHDFLWNFRELDILTQRSQDPYMRTHPMSADRMAALENRIAQSKNKDKAENPLLTERLELIQAKLHGFIDRPQATLNRYPTSDLSKEARYARSIAYFRVPDLDRALQEIDTLINEEPSNPYFQELKGQILFESGRAKDSLPYHEKSVELAPNEPLLQINLARALLGLPGSESDTAVNKRARDLLHRSVAVDSGNTLAWHQLAIAYGRLGQQPLAELATAERYYVLGRLSEAGQFANRAREGMKTGTPAWNRANDIAEEAKRATDAALQRR